MKKRLMSLLLCLCIALTLLPATARADETAAGVTIGGDVSSSGLDLTAAPTAVTRYSAGSGYIIFTPAAAAANAKLELVGATIDASANATTSTNAITLPNAPVDISVTGDNTLKAAAGGRGIYAPDNFSIGGSGSLLVSGGNHGINCTSGTLTISIAGALNVTGSSGSAVDCVGNISITAASVTASSKLFSVCSSDTVSVTATSGDITLNRTDIYGINVSGSKRIALTASSGKITVTGGANSLKSTTGNITVTAEKDITVTSGSNGINGAAVVLTSKSGSIQVVGSNNGIAASTSVSLTAAKDIAVGGNAYGCAVYAYAVPVTVTAGGTVSSASPYGWGTGALTIKANRVAITGTNGVSLQSTGSTPGVTITNSTGGSCESVNLTANGSNNAAIQCDGGDVTVKADSMVIQGKTGANAIDCGTLQSPHTLTLTGAGCVIGTCTLYPAKEEQTNIDSTVKFYNTAEAAGDAHIMDWPSGGLDLSGHRVKTTFLTDSGTAVWQPTLSGNTFTSGTLTLNGAQTDAKLSLPHYDVTIELAGAASRMGEISQSNTARTLTIAGPGSLAVGGIDIAGTSLIINGGAQVTSSKRITGGDSCSLTVTGSDTKLTATDKQSYSNMKDFTLTDHASASFTGGIAGLMLTGAGSVTEGASLTVNGYIGLMAGTGFTVDSASSFDATGTAAAVMGRGSENPFRFANLPGTMEYQSVNGTYTFWSVVAKGGTLGMNENSNPTGAAAALKLSSAAVLSDVKFTPASQTVGQTFSVSATLKDADGNALAGQPVAFRFAGGSIDKTVRGTTDAEGVAEIELAPSAIPFPAGTYAVTVSFEGSSFYGPAALTTSCTFTAASAATGSGGSTGSTDTGSTDVGAKVTIPVSSGEGSVKVEATVKDGTAAVTITDAQIKEIASGTGNVGTVRMDVSSLDVSAATVPAKVIAAADSSASATGVEVALPTGTVTLDKTALAAVSDKGGDVTVSVDKVDNAKLTETQKAVLGAQAETALVVDVTVLASGEKVSAFGGGSIGVAVPYTPKAGEDTSKLVVWFINDDGSIEPKTGFYNAKTGKYEFQTKHLSQYVLVSFPFRDVAANSWYYGSAAYAYMNGLFSGTGDTTFSPETTMTRGMLVTVLWRMAGKPVVNGAMRFADVPADAYFAKAVAWASANKLVTGYDAAAFGPNDTITREQMAAILYRYASFKGYDVGGAASLDGFTDSALVSGYAKSALAWAVNSGLVKGSGSSLMPGSGAARAQVAAILQRFVQKIGR
jgi:hypothetical protein